MKKTIELGDLKNEIEALLKMDMETSELFDVIASLNEMALTDPLTGLYNRRFMSTRLPAAYNSCIRLNKPFSIAMLDIDSFKRINDAEGHIAGDAVLKHIAESISYFIRSDTDFAIRYGGDEFLICFSGAVIEECIEICERIRTHILINPARFENKDIYISVSIGVASSNTIKRSSASIDNLVLLADKRLYEAKTAGRNRVIGESAS